MPAFAAPSAWTDVEVLVTLAVLLVAATAMFWTLVRRWESHRQEFALIDWGRRTGLKVTSPSQDALPAVLGVLKDADLVIRRCMSGGGTTLIQFQTAVSRAIESPLAPGGLSIPVAGTITWNLLVRGMASAWRPTGLRPTAARTSALDLFALASFPTLGATERFIVFGTDSDAAQSLSQSMTRSLLPPDIGILLHGHDLVLDFSDRPFDEIEFNRMLALADQIGQKLPAIEG